MTEAAAVLPSAFAHLLPTSSPTPRTRDEQHLALALAEATKGVGRTHPNPPVGAVLVDESGVFAVGHHRRAGLAHAEVECIDEARRAGRTDLRGATMVVSLEPCAHHGRTPPCAERLIEEGIGRVVIGARDPNAKVDGRGIEKLKRAGVEVVLAEGELARAAEALIAPFATLMRESRPYVVVKVATSLDGRVATASGHSRFITGDAARGLVHRLRASVDAILVGSGTARADDPALTARDVGQAVVQPRRVLVDGALSLPPDATLFARRDDDRAPPLVMHTATADVERARALDARGVVREAFEGERVPLAAALSRLAALSHMSVLVEPGPGLMGALLAHGLIDELWWMTAPIVLGADARPAAPPLGLARVDDGTRFTPAAPPLALGDDVVSIWRRAPR